MATILTTQRLMLRHLEARDAPFIYDLVNDPAWLEFIGDRGVRSLADAERYIADGPVAMYQREGFGLFCVVLAATGEAIGLCGLIRRTTLPDVDIGFALAAPHRGSGLISEAGQAVVSWAWEVASLPRLLAITSLHNVASIRVLEKLGFHFERVTTVGDDTEPLRLFALDRPAELTTAG